MWDVACLGDLLIDLVPHSMSGGEWLYAPSPGGAPGNVAVGLAKLDRRVVMIGKVAEDTFGNLIVSALHGHGVDTAGVSRTRHERTAMSVVTLGPGGERFALAVESTESKDTFMAEAKKIKSVLSNVRADSAHAPLWVELGI